MEETGLRLPRTLDPGAVEYLRSLEISIGLITNKWGQSKPINNS